MKFLFLTLIALHVVSGQPERGDQSPPREEDWDIGNKTLEEDYFDEDFQEMTPENTQHNGGSALERINVNQLNQVDDGERHESYPVWKMLLVVAGSAVGLVLLVSSVILVLKGRNNNKEGKGSEEPSVPKEDET